MKLLPYKVFRAFRECIGRGVDASFYANSIGVSADNESYVYSNGYSAVVYGAGVGVHLCVPIDKILNDENVSKVLAIKSTKEREMSALNINSDLGIAKFPLLDSTIASKAERVCTVDVATLKKVVDAFYLAGQKRVSLNACEREGPIRFESQDDKKMIGFVVRMRD